MTTQEGHFARFEKDDGAAGRFADSQTPITPVPPDAPPPGFRHRQWGFPSATWEYRDADQRLLGYAARFDTSEGKQILPRTFCRQQDGSSRWSWKSFRAPRPLYGLDRLAERPHAPVLVVEGEKTTDAAQVAFRDFVAVTWPGGAKAVSRADWAHLNGRRIVLWPDADAEGAAAMADVRRLLGQAKVQTVVLPDGLPEGWDLADPIPAGIDIQCILVGDGVSADAEPILPPGYLLNANGLFWREDEEDVPGMMLSGPFDILAETRDGEGTSWGMLLSWRDHDGREHRYALPRSILAGDGAEARKVLLDGGLNLSPVRKAREKLNNFLVSVRSPCRARATGRVGWHSGIFVLPDESIGRSEESEQLLLQQSTAVKHSFRQQGSLLEWRDEVAKFALGNSRLVLAISAAFGAALLEPCKAESGGIHFRGASSTGKSTALLMAASVWGGGDPGGYVRSWRATANGLEGVALAHCDSLLCLDELSQVPSRDAGEAAYMLGNGSGKSRSTREGLAKHTAQWRTLFLSSGEMSLADKIAEDGRGKRAAAGQAVRLIDLPADAGGNLGLFEDLHGFDSADAFARHLKKVSTSFYGTAARAFLRHVAADLTGLADAVASHCREYVGNYVPAHADGQVHRVAQRFALIAMAGEIAANAGIVPWTKGAAIEASARCLQDWVEARGGIEPAEVQGGIDQVRAFVSAHGASRFLAAWEEEANHQLRDIAGYRKLVGEDWEYFVTSPAWNNEVCKGFNAATIAAALKQRDLLIAPEQGRYTTAVRVPGCGRPRLYHLSTKLLEGGRD